MQGAWRTEVERDRLVAGSPVSPELLYIYQDYFNPFTWLQLAMIDHVFHWGSHQTAGDTLHILTIL